jgi:hypothetical protein
MAKANWADIEELVKDWFEAGQQPTREEIMDRAYERDCNDDIIDAVDALNGKPVPSLEVLKQQMTDLGVI